MNFTAKARFKSTSQQNKHQLSVSVSVFYEKLELDEEPNITKKVPYKQKTLPVRYYYRYSVLDECMARYLCPI